jgi:hypothetical protein
MHHLNWAILILICFFSFLSQAESPNEFKKQEKAIREQMRDWSRQLGVTCKSCHDVNNFKSDKLSAFKIGKEHMKITQLLIDNGMDGKLGPKADCYMCHRGQLKPSYKEKENPMTH